LWSEDERYCIDVVTQINAVRAALDKIALGLVDDHVRHCLKDPRRADEHADEPMNAVWQDAFALVRVAADRVPRVPRDLEDDERDDEADDRVGHREAESHHRRASDHPDADEAVNARVIAIRH
jgi:hypothetical protein